MANLFFNIPVPAANGVGAAVDVSTAGKTKTLVIGGGFRATVNVEFATDLAGTDWAPLATFHQSGNLTIDVAAHWMRAVTTDYISGAPNLDVGANDAGSAFVLLPLAGTSTDISALAQCKTVVVPQGFVGTVDISEDGVSWAQIFSFPQSSPNSITREIVGQFARVLGGVDGVAVDVFIGGSAESSSGGGAATSGGEAGITGAGTALDPFVPVGGPFRPVTDIFVCDDYLVSYGPQPGGVPTTLGVGYTSILKTAGGVAQFSCNLAAGPLGPGVGSMMGVMDLQLIGAGANQYITAVQFRPGDDSGTAIDTAQLEGPFDLWMSARVSFEGLNNFETTQMAWAGFWSQIDQPSFNLANREGAYFHPKDNGLQTNWFARYRLFDDSGVVTADVDTGVRVGFTAAHPTDGRAAQNLLVRIQGPAATASLTMAIDGVIVVGPIPLTNPASRFTPMCALESIAAAQSQTMYVDWMLWGLKGRTT